jgi:CubicO group peptidase (beta-lactamase class C family)
MKTTQVAGAADAIAKDGKVHYAGNFDVRSPKTEKLFTYDTVFPAGSIPSLFTAMLAVQFSSNWQ